jgi:hypothetical protein
VVYRITQRREWPFEQRLSEAQHGELDRILVAVWRRGNRDSIKGTAQVIEMQAKVGRFAGDQRDTVRAAGVLL